MLQAAAELARRCFPAKRGDLLAGLAERVQQGAGLLRDLSGVGLQQSGDSIEQAEAALDQLVGAATGDGLDAPQPGSDAALAGDQEQTDVARFADVRPAAQLV